MNKFNYRSNWKGPLYSVFNKWFLREQDEAIKYYNCAEQLKVNPLNINYCNDKNFDSGTWIYITETSEDIDAFVYLFPYCPTVCLKQGWNYVVYADDILKTYTRKDIIDYLENYKRSIPENIDIMPQLDMSELSTLRGFGDNRGSK